MGGIKRNAAFGYRLRDNGYPIKILLKWKIKMKTYENPKLHIDHRDFMYQPVRYKIFKLDTLKFIQINVNPTGFVHEFTGKGSDCGKLYRRYKNDS